MRKQLSNSSELEKIEAWQPPNSALSCAPNAV
ncbi:Uncharacterised protein [Vibrio cholerae]|nr:Uncharacterised protein [Vibrio cholerae]